MKKWPDNVGRDCFGMDEVSAGGVSRGWVRLAMNAGLGLFKVRGVIDDVRRSALGFARKVEGNEIVL